MYDEFSKVLSKSKKASGSLGQVELCESPDTRFDEVTWSFHPKSGPGFK